MTTFSFAVSPAHEAVARGLVGAHATDPVVPSAGPALARPRAPRSRSALAAALHRIADTVAPAESCSAC